MGITLVDDLLDWGGRALQDYRPHFGTDRPISSTPPSWYITPRQTFLELIVWNVFFWSALWYMLKRTGFPGPLQLPRRGKRSITGFEKLMGGVVLITLSWVLWYKYKTNTVVYILQPCHIVSVLLIYLCWCSNVRTGSLVFAIFTHTNVGTLLAIGFPDTSDYHRRGYMTHFTVVNFFILHYVLALLPLYFEWTQTLRFKKSLYANIFGWVLLGIWHWSILLPVSIVAENNLNYIMSPPPKGPLLSLGPYYRSVQTVGTLPMVMVPGFLFPALVRGVKRLLSSTRSLSLFFAQKQKSTTEPGARPTRRHAAESRGSSAGTGAGRAEVSGGGPVTTRGGARRRSPSPSRRRP